MYNLNTWHIGSNKIHVYHLNVDIGGFFPVTAAIVGYSILVDGSSLYELLRRGDWHVYVANTNPVCLMLSTHDVAVTFYKIELQEFNEFLYYYCGARYQQELDWRKCGF